MNERVNKSFKLFAYLSVPALVICWVQSESVQRRKKIVACNSCTEDCLCTSTNHKLYESSSYGWLCVSECVCVLLPQTHLYLFRRQTVEKEVHKKVIVAAVAIVNHAVAVVVVDVVAFLLTD